MFTYEWPGNDKACNCKLWNEDATPLGSDGEILMHKRGNEFKKFFFEKGNS